MSPTKAAVARYDENRKSYILAILAGLQAKPTIYAGTVPAHVKAARRRKGAVAKQSRKVNRNG